MSKKPSAADKSRKSDPHEIARLLGEKLLVGRRVRLLQQHPRVSGSTGCIIGAESNGSWIVRMDYDSETHVAVPFYAIEEIDIDYVARMEQDVRVEQPKLGQGYQALQLDNGIIIHTTDLSRPAMVFDFNPETFVPQPDGDGKVRYWGFDPFERPDDRWDADSLDGKRYRYRISQSNFYFKAGIPEHQVARLLSEKKLQSIQQNKASRKRFYKLSLVVRIQLTGVEPPVYRDVRVSGSMSLRTFSGKVIQATLGWARCYHSYVFTDFKDGSIYGHVLEPQQSGLGKQSTHDTDFPSEIDGELFLGYHGHVLVNDEKVRLGDLVGEVGDELGYIYDLGVRWEHSITVLEVGTTTRGEGERIMEFFKSHCICVGGQGESPPEDCNGLDGEGFPTVMACSAVPETGVWSIDTLYISMNGNAKFTRAISAEGALNKRDHPNYEKCHREALGSFNLKHRLKYEGATRYDWRSFDLMEVNALLADALVVNVSGEGCLCCNRELDDRSDSELRRLLLCSVCGNAYRMKLCSGCGRVAYCSKEHQKQHWPEHKKECKQRQKELAEKKKKDEEEKEKAQA